MITGYNLTLKPPMIKKHSPKLLENNNEVKSLIKAIKKYFKQENVIYNADLTLSNNEWEEYQLEFGSYKKRKDYTIRLMDIYEIILDTNSIEFHIYNENEPNTSLILEISKDFFWFFEWESAYYN